MGMTRGSILRFVALVALALVLGTTAADAAAGLYAQLAPRDQRIVDALFASQRPPRPRLRLSKEDFASLKTDGDWDSVFKDLKGAGFYPHADGLREIVAAQPKTVNKGGKGNGKKAKKKNKKKNKRKSNAARKRLTQGNTYSNRDYLDRSEAQSNRNE